MGHTQPFSITDGTNNIKDIALKTAPTVSVESWSSMPPSKLTASEEDTKELVFDNRIYGDDSGAKPFNATQSELKAPTDVAEVAKTPDGAVLYSKWTGKPQEKATDRKVDSGAEPTKEPKGDDGKPEEKPQAVLVPTGADDKAKVGSVVIIPSNTEQVIERKTEVVGPGKVGALKPAGEEKPTEKVDAKPATGEDNRKADVKPATGEDNKKADAKPATGDENKRADAKPDTTADGASDKTKTDKKDALSPAQEKEVSEKMGQFKQDLISGNFVLNFKKGEGPFQALTRMRGEALAKQKAGKDVTPQEHAMAMLSEKDVLTVSRAIRDRDFKSMKDDHGKSRQWYSTKDQTPRYTKEDMEAAAKAKEATLRQEAAKNVEKREEPKAPEQPKKEEPAELPKKVAPAPEQPKKEQPKKAEATEEEEMETC